jgi:hypothetical protein
MTIKSLATLEAELETFLSWYDSNPMKAVLVSLTQRDIAAIKAEQARLARKAELEAKAAAFAALPWYKRLFRSSL